jgi:energy-coupling factor transporter ATP-binding protein EcfA2
MEAHAFTLLCGFAAPLMHFTEDAGTIVSLVGPSGSGKTQAALGAMSIYGEDRGMEITTRDNMVTRFTSLGVLGNLPAVTNDAHKMPQEHAENYALNFTDGRDKMRGRVDGGIIMARRSWKTIMILTANNSIVDKIGTAEDAKRIFEFSVALPSHCKLKDGKDQQLALRANRGTAGDWWIRRLVDPKVAYFAKKNVSRMVEDYSDRLGSRPEDRFWVRLFACVGVAAKLVEHFGLLEFSPKRIMDWAIERALELRDVAESVDQSAANHLARFLDLHQANTLIVSPARGLAWNIVQQPRNGMFIRIELGQDMLPNRCYIEQKRFREWAVGEKLFPHQMRKELLAYRICLRFGWPMVLGKGTHWAGGQVKIMEIDMTHQEMTPRLKLEIVKAS